MVRKFQLKNEKGQTFSLMDIENYCLLTEPSGLGYAYSNDYVNLGNSFILNLRVLEQGQISGQLNFLCYDNYKKFVDYVEGSEKLYFSYIVPYKSGSKEFLRDIQMTDVSKTEIQPNGVMSETVIFTCLTLWYATSTAIYTIDSNGGDEIRWDFTWDSYFAGYDARDLSIINTGHTDATIEVSIDGQVANPELQLYIENDLYQDIQITDVIDSYEKFLYSSKEGDFYIKKENTDGTYTSLLDLSVIDFSQNLVIRIPKNKSCRLVLNADNNISRATITIFVYYKAV